ncbi:hypothetical protein C8J56DRAFT_922137 [Mycena floridula]|nr:hypothetical protein C8J56DRAFT_922137 [Mycena floridula]
MSDMLGKWGSGQSYGPVVKQRDLYILEIELELHPILSNTDKSFHLVFDLRTGKTEGNHPSTPASSPDLPFNAKDEPATLPRTDVLFIITEISPWCTIIKNERGVTLGDILTGVYKDYAEHWITEAEFSAVPDHVRDQIRRMSSQNQGSNWFYNPAPPSRSRRLDWLRERTWFDGLRTRESYVQSRLGFRANNTFIMDLQG